MTRLIVAAAPRMTSRPTSVEPVKPIFATSGCSTSRAPTTDPLPTSTLTTPSEIPASSASSTSRSAESGVSSAGFGLTVFPHASAGPELPRRDVEREVPRHDQPHDAERLAKGQVDAARDGDRLAVVLVDGPGVEVEDVRDHLDLAAGAGDRLAHVPRLDLREAPRRAPRRASPGAAADARGRSARPRASPGTPPSPHARPPLPLPRRRPAQLGDRLLGRGVQHRQRHVRVAAFCSR